MTKEQELILQIEEAIANLKEIRANLIKEAQVND